MKVRTFFIASLCFSISFVLGCKGKTSDSVGNFNLEISTSEVTLPYSGGSSEVRIKSEREWTAYSDDKWIECKVYGGSDKSGHIQISVSGNDKFELRKGKVTVKSGTLRKNISIVQESRPEIANKDIVVPDGYRLVWNDEFDDKTTDSPDESKWFYETGNNGWGNDEIQNYIHGKKDGISCAEVKNGILKIIAQKIGDEVCSVRLNSKESWKYGYFEARLKLPKGKGTWPAFWMMPSNFTKWPDDGEIDIMEEVGYKPDYVSSSIHTKSYNHIKGTQKTNEVLVSGSQNEFHVYALEWTEEYIKTFVDGKEIFHYGNDEKGNADSWPFNAPFYIKLNLAWGGNWGGAKGVDENALPAIYEIDYVRVFQKK